MSDGESAERESAARESAKTPVSSLDCPPVYKPVLEKIAPHTTDVGGIAVNRVLPRRQRRLISAWCFLDHIGPVADGAVDLHVGAHPHIGLQTFTWMMQGEILHRDSLGTEQVIRPGQVNLMTAGRGIAHTEDALPGQTAMHAAQLWIALPGEHAATAPRFDHYPQLPQWREQDLEITLLTGDYAGECAPTLQFSPLVGMDLAAAVAGAAEFTVRADFEYGLLPLQGIFRIEDSSFAANELVYLGCGRDRLRVDFSAHSRALLIGGAPVAEEVLIWWNFVGHSRAAIMEAQREWEAGSARFGAVPGSVNRLVPPPIPWRV